jgi:hypothetical protein
MVINVENCETSNVVLIKTNDVCKTATIYLSVIVSPQQCTYDK